jgi:hypothetical protein
MSNIIVNNKTGIEKNSFDFLLAEEKTAAAAALDVLGSITMNDVVK